MKLISTYLALSKSILSELYFEEANEQVEGCLAPIGQSFES